MYVKLLNGGAFFMAKRGQIFEKYSNEFREIVVQEYLNSKDGYFNIAKKYNIASWKTVETWVRKFRNFGTTINLKTKETEIDYKVRYEILKKYQAFLKDQQEKK